MRLTNSEFARLTAVLSDEEMKQLKLILDNFPNINDYQYRHNYEPNLITREPIDQLVITLRELGRGKTNHCFELIFNR